MTINQYFDTIVVVKIKVLTLSATRRPLLEEAASFYANRLNLQKSRYDLVICTVVGLSKKEGALAKTATTDHYKITVGIDSRLDVLSMILALAHEMVHVKQLARGQVKAVVARNGKIQLYWLGKRIKARYHEQPWEIEAVNRESVLFAEFVKKASG